MNTFTIRVIDRDTFDERRDLIPAVLKAREEMCEIVNGPNGMIHKWWNPMLDAVGITDPKLRMETDDVAYMAVTNAIWTMKLREEGYNIRILSEVFYPDDESEVREVGVCVIYIRVEA